MRLQKSGVDAKSSVLLFLDESDAETPLSLRPNTVRLSSSLDQGASLDGQETFFCRFVGRHSVSSPCCISLSRDLPWNQPNDSGEVGFVWSKAKDLSQGSHDHDMNILRAHGREDRFSLTLN